jgi:hypothetical protein
MFRVAVTCFPSRPVVSTSMFAVPCPLIIVPADIFHLNIVSKVGSPPETLAVKVAGYLWQDQAGTCTSRTSFPLTRSSTAARYFSNCILDVFESLLFRLALGPATRQPWARNAEAFIRYLQKEPYRSLFNLRFDYTRRGNSTAIKDQH